MATSQDPENGPPPEDSAIEEGDDYPEANHHTTETSNAKPIALAGSVLAHRNGD